MTQSMNQGGKAGIRLKLTECVIGAGCKWQWPSSSTGGHICNCVSLHSHRSNAAHDHFIVAETACRQLQFPMS